PPPWSLAGFPCYTRPLRGVPSHRDDWKRMLGIDRRRRFRMRRDAGCRAGGDGNANERREGGNDGASSRSGGKSGEAAGGVELRRESAGRRALSEEPGMRLPLLPGWNLPEWSGDRAPEGVTVHAEQPVQERCLCRLPEQYPALQVMTAERRRRP